VSTISNAYEVSRNLPDIEIHLENLPYIEKEEALSIKRPIHNKHHKHKTKIKKTIHVETKIKEVKPQITPITIIPPAEVMKAPADLKQTIVDSNLEKHEPIVVDKITPSISHFINNPSIIILNYQKSEITLNAINIEKLAILKSAINNGKGKIINIVGYSSDDNTKDLNIIGNQALQRVVEVRKYLISQNIDPSLIAIHSASNKLPITTEDKVEITIIDSTGTKK
jgi:outer membrane protein OmpA-like peptidoglycan-associated protein